MSLSTSKRVIKNYSDEDLRALYAINNIQKSMFQRSNDVLPDDIRKSGEVISAEMKIRNLDMGTAMADYSNEENFGTDQFYVILRTKEYERHLENEGAFLAKGGHVIYHDYNLAVAAAKRYCHGDSDRSYFVAKCVARIEMQKPIEVVELT